MTCRFPATFAYRLLSCAAIGAALVCFLHPAQAQTVVDADGKPITIGGKAVALTVEGNGSVRVKPDYCSLEFRVRQEGTNKTEVFAAYNKKVETLAEAAKKLNVSLQKRPPELRIPSGSGSYSVLPVDSPVRPGERLILSLSITTDSHITPDQSLPLIRAFAATKAAETIVVSYGAREDSRYRSAALKKAVEDASTRAQIMETAAKPQRLKLLAMEEGSFGCNPAYFVLSPDDPLPSLDFLTVSAQANITLRYALTDPPTQATKPAAAKAPARKPAVAPSRMVKN